MEQEKIESAIAESILSSNDINLSNISDSDLNNLIKEKVTEENYLKEDWQVNYAVERIRGGINKRNEVKSIEEAKVGQSKETLLQALRKRFGNKKIFNSLGIVSVTLGIIGIFILGLIFGISALLLGKIARKEKQKFSTLGIILGVVDIIIWVISLVIFIISNGVSQSAIGNILGSAFVGAGFAFFMPHFLNQKK